MAVEILDLASLSSVRAFAERWKASGRSLDLLVCNGELVWEQLRSVQRHSEPPSSPCESQLLFLMNAPAACFPCLCSGHHGATGAHHHRRRLRASVPGAHAHVCHLHAHEKARKFMRWVGLPFTRHMHRAPSLHPQQAFLAVVQISKHGLLT